MEDHIRLKTGEVENLRFLARCMLEQKTNVDRFFLQGLEYIKDVTAALNKENSRFKANVERTRPSTNDRSLSSKRSKLSHRRLRSVESYVGRERSKNK